MCNVKNSTSNAETTKIETMRIDSTLSENNIYIMLLMNRIKYPEVVISQIMIETGYLTSKLCKANNNLLGMMVPSKRETTATNNKGFAKYTNWMDCISDYKLYQDYILSRNKIDNKKQYIAFLHRNYAKSPLYKKRLTELSNKYELRNTYNFTSL
jgi:flagellum-specific peptidoglycan hydrolase FlgJ